MSDTNIELSWYEVQPEDVEGKGWQNTDCPFDRLPRHAESEVPEAVWQHSRTSTGMCVHFRSNVTAVHARWQLRRPQLGEPNFAVAGFSGLDLYGKHEGEWRWAACTPNIPDQHPDICMISDLDGEDREYCLYLPLRNPVDKLAIGVPATAEFSVLPPRNMSPLVFYGSSIVHGAYASHPGIVHPAIIGRRLGMPILNLGFSGVAKMELAVADLLAELDAAVYIIDPLPNMDLALVSERAFSFLKQLHDKRPEAPIVFVEDRPLTNYWARSKVKRDHEEKWMKARAIVENLKQQGAGNIYYIEGHDLFGTDTEASLDSSHPSDLGFMRMADKLLPVLQSLGPTQLT